MGRWRIDSYVVRTQYDSLESWERKLYRLIGPPILCGATLEMIRAFLGRFNGVLMIASDIYDHGFLVGSVHDPIYSSNT